MKLWVVVLVTELEKEDDKDDCGGDDKHWQKASEQGVQWVGTEESPLQVCRIIPETWPHTWILTVKQVPPKSYLLLPSSPTFNCDGISWCVGPAARPGAIISVWAEAVVRDTNSGCVDAWTVGVVSRDVLAGWDEKVCSRLSVVDMLRGVGVTERLSEAKQRGVKAMNAPQSKQAVKIRLI